MKSKLLRRTAAFVLALTMALSTAMYASAGPTTPPKPPYTITINDDYGSATGKYVAYQIFKGDVVEGTGKENTLTGIEWGNGIDSDALLTDLITHTAEFEAKIPSLDAAKKPIFKDGQKATEIAAILETYSGNADFVMLFATYAGENIKGSGTDLTRDTTGKKYEGSVAEAGYYLIKDESTTADPYAYSTHILKVASQNVTENAKHSMPKVDKKITAEDSETITGGTTARVAGIGDTVSYSLTGTLPSNYADYEHLYYQFTDTLPKGLSLKEGTIKIQFGTNTAQTVGTKTATSDFYYTLEEVEVEGVKTGEMRLSVIVNDVKKVTGLTEDSQIIVTYDCTVNTSAGIYADGKKDNKNTVDLTFTNSPHTGYDGNGTPGNTTTTTEKDEADVLVLRLNIIKMDDAENPLKDAEFTISRKIGTTVEYAVVTEDSTDGKYTIKEWTTVEASASKFKTPASGNIEINGLDDDVEYTITEVTPPTGYTGIEPFTITLKAAASEASGVFNLTMENPVLNPATDTHVSATKDMTTEEPKTDIGSVTVTVINDKDSNLPSTGGSGVYFYYAVGGGLVAVSAITLVLTRKKKKS